LKNKIAFLLPLRSVLFILSFLFLFLAFNKPFGELSKWWSVVATLCNIVTLLILLAVCRKIKTSYGKFINYEKEKTKVKTVLIIVVVILVVGMGGMYLAGLICYHKFPYMAVMMIQPIPLWIAILNVLILPLTTTLAEDGIYLGVINQTDSKFVLGLSAFFYAFQHSFIPFLPDFRFVAYRFLSFLPLTIIMCIWYRKNKNPLPIMIGHFVINLATVAQILMTSASPILFEQLKSMS